MTGVAAGASPSGLPESAVEGRTDFGAPGFGGACPPEGAAPHHYVFTHCAMPEAALPLDGNASGAMFGFHALGLALEHVVLTATYGRQACTGAKALV